MSNYRMRCWWNGCRSRKPLRELGRDGVFVYTDAGDAVPERLFLECSTDGGGCGSRWTHFPGWNAVAEGVPAEIADKV